MAIRTEIGKNMAMRTEIRKDEKLNVIFLYMYSYDLSFIKYFASQLMRLNVLLYFAINPTCTYDLFSI